MNISLHHMIVYVKKHDQAAQEFADVMNLPYGRMAGASIIYNYMR